MMEMLIFCSRVVKFATVAPGKANEIGGLVEMSASIEGAYRYGQCQIQRTAESPPNN